MRFLYEKRSGSGGWGEVGEGGGGGGIASIREKEREMCRSDWRVMLILANSKWLA